MVASSIASNPEMQIEEKEAGGAKNKGPVPVNYRRGWFRPDKRGGSFWKGSGGPRCVGRKRSGRRRRRVKKGWTFSFRFFNDGARGSFTSPDEMEKYRRSAVKYRPIWAVTAVQVHIRGGPKRSNIFDILGAFVTAFSRGFTRNVLLFRIGTKDDVDAKRSTWILCRISLHF